MTTSNTTTDGGTTATFSRLTRRGVLLGLGPSQLVVLAFAGVALVAALVAGGMAVAYAAPLILACAALCWIRLGGRPVVEWLPVATVWVRRGITGQLDYRARIGTPRPAGTLALPGDAARLRQWVDAETGGVMIHDPHAATLTAVVGVTHPSFVLLDAAEQARRVAAWGRVLASTCRSGNVATLQVLERTLPDSGKGLAAWWTTQGTDDGGWAARTYADLIDRAGPTGERHATTIALTISLRAAARAVRAAGGGLRGGATVLRQEVTSLTTALRAADLTPTGMLDAGEVALAIRAAYDPTVGAALERHGAIGRDLATAGPLAVTESWGHLRADGAYHCVLWISEWPRTVVYPAFLTPLLLAPGVRRTLSLTFTPVRADVAARDLRRKKTEYISDAAQRNRLGQIEDASQAAEYTDVLQQEADLTAGHGVLRAVGLVTVTAPTLEELERAVAAVEQAAIQASCETRRLWGQQARTFIRAALPVAMPI
ncbi:PrgI family protein [Xylanimonas allomyrinae]|uniref:PrgI family protein n=1 Tax=Xylanimonas allomyrinae TaxID=2509459 RepID=A0A4V0YEA6_9MICO|nr:SCO6880 family protein [Xylanimonas allomyrinae]QAY63541.1 PrgI family protein [Xylanimonas allomyrinae]